MDRRVDSSSKKERCTQAPVISGNQKTRRACGGKFSVINRGFDIFRGLHTVPVLYTGPWAKTLLDKYGRGASLVPYAANQAEGCVITATDPTRWERNLGRVQLKFVSNEFLEGDSK